MSATICDVLLALSLPALRALSAIARGAINDNDLRAAGVSRSCVAGATRELRECGLIATAIGRAASPGVRGIASSHILLNCKIDIDIDVSQLTLAQSRVLLALRAEKYKSTRSLAKKCSLSEPATRDAIKFFSAKNLLSEQTENFHSTPPYFSSHCETAPQEFSQHSQKVRPNEIKTELNTVLNTKEKQQTAVVVNFSIYQKLLEHGISNDVAAQLISHNENECALQITRLKN